LQGNLSGVAYRDNVLNATVVPQFDNHPLADGLIFMDNNARPHRPRIVREFRQQEAIDTFQGPAVSLDMNPIEHVWDFIGLAVKLTNIIHNVKILLN
jgi:transposase